MNNSMKPDFQTYSLLLWQNETKNKQNQTKQNQKTLDCEQVNPMFSVTLTTRSDCSQSQSDQRLSYLENPNQPRGNKNGRFGGHV